MNVDAIRDLYAQLHKVHGVTRTVIAAFPPDALDWIPAEGARSARQIVEHVYGSSVPHAESVLTGHLTKEDYARHEDAPRGPSVSALVTWCDGKERAMQEKARAATPEQLAATVHTFYGDFPGWQMLAFNYDEHWHHRGQLTVYLRLRGIPVPFIYNYE